MRRARSCVLTMMSIAAALWLSACEPFIPAPPPLIAAPTPPPLPAPPQAAVTPAGVRAEIAKWFAAAGYKDFQIAALLEHARIESGFHPCAAGPAGLRYTYQWGSTRLERLYAYAGTRSCPPLEKQLAFANDELRNEPKFACFWQATNASSALAELRRGFGRGSCDVVVATRRGRSHERHVRRR